MWGIVKRTALVAKRAKKLKPNARRAVYEYAVGEKAPETWYLIDRSGGDYEGNPGPLHFVSPAALQTREARIVDARRILPSPFTMVAAMA